MKRILFVLVLASSSVFACPQLTGNYTCTGTEDSYQMSIAQGEEDGVTTYSLTMGDEVSDYVADGIERPHTVMVNNEAIEGTLATSCLENGVGIKFLTKYNGADIDYTDGYTVLEDGSLSEEITTLVNGEPYSTDTYSCTRDN